MNRRGTEPYARWCGRTAGAIPPPTRFQDKVRPGTGREGALGYERYIAIEYMDVRRDCVNFTGLSPIHPNPNTHLTPHRWGSWKFLKITITQIVRNQADSNPRAR